MYTPTVAVLDIFARLLPLAAQHGLRVVALNRRGYAPSSSLSPDEAAVLAGTRITPSDAHTTDDSAHTINDTDTAIAVAQTTFLHARAAEVGEFLAWLVTHKQLPPPRPSPNPLSGSGARDGGLALLGWSLGALIPVSLLSFSSTLPSSILSTLAAYLHTPVIYEPAPELVGRPLPSGGFHPLHTHDPELDADPEKKMAEFRVWVTSYFAHDLDLDALNRSLNDPSASLDFDPDGAHLLPHLTQHLQRTPPRARTVLTAADEARCAPADARALAVDAAPLSTKV